jgi:hypothetical protein
MFGLPLDIPIDQEKGLLGFGHCCGRVKIRKHG